MADRKKNRIVESNVNRARQIRRNDNVENVNVSLMDIDEAITYYFENIIMPKITDSTGEVVDVPLIYGSPQRWKSAQNAGVFRDKDGKLQTPLIMYRRTGITKNNTLGRHFDHAQNNLHYVFENKRTQKNRYDRFSILNNRTHVKEYHKVVVPDYVDLSYDFIVWTEFIEQQNKVIEAIQYSAGEYWGDKSKFTFMAQLESFDLANELAESADRTVKSNFSVTLKGYIIPDVLQKKMNEDSQKYFGHGKVVFGSELISIQDNSANLLDYKEDNTLPQNEEDDSLADALRREQYKRKTNL